MEDEMGGTCSTYEEMRNGYKISFVKPWALVGGCCQNVASK
jgi:hypothetical protein